MRIIKKLTVSLTQELKDRLLHWANQFDEVVWMDSNGYEDEHGSFQGILAVDALTSIKSDFLGAFDKLDEYQTYTKDWIFGYLSYDLKNDQEDLVSKNLDILEFPEIFFFQPKRLFFFYKDHVEMVYMKLVEEEMDNDWKKIMDYRIDDINISESKSDVKIQLRTSKDSYFEKLKDIQHHIHRGDIYEANFCQEFYSENTSIDPVRTYIHLNQISEPPFATFLKIDDHFALSASPERYLAKKGNRLISQPIKGTAKRLSNENKDLHIKETLKNDPKERSENIMIVDLVRNDLSRIADRGSVSVSELCGIYTFKQVHQLISTITCTVSDSISPSKILENTYPMGSMTGAPKISAMKTIEANEDAKRGLYSGSIGYISPEGEFDFNVVIRTILYNRLKQYVSYSVGGAITSRSIPEKEYEECLIKAKAMREALEG
jgi:para-aminobenzoate synthetase component 1